MDDRKDLNTSKDLRSSLSNVTQEDFKKGLSQLDNEKVMNDLAAVLASTPGIDEIGKQASKDPRLANAALEARKDMNKKDIQNLQKQVKQMKKKAAEQKTYVEGVIIMGKSIKGYNAEIRKDQVDITKLAPKIMTASVTSTTIDDFQVFYSTNASSSSKLIDKLFPGNKMGVNILIIRKDLTSLSVDIVNQMIRK